MSFAWQTTTEDIQNVCANNNEPISEDVAQSILERLDLDKVEKEALRGDDMDEQIDSAYKEIWEQIIQLNIF